MNHLKVIRFNTKTYSIIKLCMDAYIKMLKVVFLSIKFSEKNVTRKKNLVSQLYHI